MKATSCLFNVLPSPAFLGKHITRPHSNGEQRRILLFEAEQLKPERKLFGFENRQRNRRYAQKRSGGCKDWIARRLQADRRRARGGKRNCRIGDAGQRRE